MSGILNSLQGILSNITKTFYNVLDRILPPEKRAEILAKIQNFAINNPKLAAFLTAQIILTGFPLLLFLAFTISVGLFSLITALLIGLLAAVLFTIFMVGVALLVVLPTIFFTTFAASFIFLWGLGGYYILKWFNEGDQPSEPGTAIGDKLNNWTGGRMSWFMDGARKKQEDQRTGADQTPRIHGSEDNESEKKGNATGPPKLNPTKNASEGKEQLTKQTNGVQKKATKPASDAANTVSTAKNAAKETTSVGS